MQQRCDVRLPFGGCYTFTSGKLCYYHAKLAAGLIIPQTYRTEIYGCTPIANGSPYYEGSNYPQWVKGPSKKKTKKAA